MYAYYCILYWLMLIHMYAVTMYVTLLLADDFIWLLEKKFRVCIIVRFREWLDVMTR